MSKVGSIELSINKTIVDKLTEAISLLKDLEWSGHVYAEEDEVYYGCPTCGGDKPNHEEDCRLKQVIG